MKPIKKILAGALAASLLCCTGAVGAAAQDLRFRNDGKFRILAFADTHQTTEDQPKMIAFLNEAIDYAKPDLVVFVGDNVRSCYTYETEMVALAKILTPAVSRGIPFAFVYGNHDTDEYHPGGRDGRAELMGMYQSFDGCLARAADPATPGASNFNLPIYGSKNASKMAANLWFFDTDHGTVPQSQIGWYKNASRQLQKKNGGKPVPSLAFQHIIVPEIDECFPVIPFRVPLISRELRGAHRLLIPDFRKLTGLVMEGEGYSPTEDTGQFDAWVERGDIFAAVFGHSHTNNFIAPIRGIDLVQIPGTAFSGSYGSDIVRGAALFILDENKPRSYQKQDIPYWKLAIRPGSRIGWPFLLSESQYWILFGVETALQAPITLVKWVMNLL